MKQSYCCFLSEFLGAYYKSTTNYYHWEIDPLELVSIKYYIEVEMLCYVMLWIWLLNIVVGGAYYIIKESYLTLRTCVTCHNAASLKSCYHYQEYIHDYPIITISVNYMLLQFAPFVCVFYLSQFGSYIICLPASMHKDVHMATWVIFDLCANIAFKSGLVIVRLWSLFLILYIHVNYLVYATGKNTIIF